MSKLQKFCFVLTLCMITGVSQSNAAKNFINNFPFNIGYGSIFSDQAKVCMCGITTQLLAKEGMGPSIEMYRLVQADFNWMAATRRDIEVNWSTMKLAKEYSGSTVWFGPADNSYISYELQAKKMFGILSKWAKIVQTAGVNIQVTGCTPYVTYFSGNFLKIISNGYIKGKEIYMTQANRNKFASDHKITKFFDYEENGKYKMAYPEDFTQVSVESMINNGVAVNRNGNSNGKLNFAGVKLTPRINGVGCPVTMEPHGSVTKKKNGAVIFYDSGEVKKFYGTTTSSFDFKWGNSFEFMADLYKNGNSFDRTSGAVTSVDAFMFNHDAEKPEDMANRDYVIENFLLPNLFDVTFCYSILNPTEIGKFFKINETEWDKIFARYRLQCPILGMVGGIVFKYQIQGQWEYFRYFGMVSKPKGLFDIEKGATTTVNGYLDYFIDISKVTFDENPDFEGNLKKGEEGVVTLIKTVQTTVDELPDLSEHTPEITPIDIESIKQKAQQMVSIKDKTPEESVHTEYVEDVQEEIVLTPEEDETVRLCRQRKEQLEKRYSEMNVVPEKVSQVNEMILEMMAHPIKYLCTDFVIFIFTLGKITLINPPMVVMKWIVTEVDPKVLEANGQDPNKKVFEIRFYNDYFDDQKEILLYIPATEIVNEWDKYSMILVDFHEWVAAQMAELLDLKSVINNIFAAINQRLVSPYEEWSVTVGPSGPMDKSGSSGAGEFIEMMDMDDLPYINIIMRLTRSVEFYDIIIQTWTVGDRYIMLKLQATQLSFQVLINKFSTTAKLIQIYDSIFDALKENFLGSDRIVSLIAAKTITYHSMRQIALDSGFGFEKNLIDLPGKIFEDAERGHGYMISSDDNAFMYSINANLVGQTFIIRGFVHNRENIPVMNLYFSTEYFQSEYIIPLVSHSMFKVYMDNVFGECFDHFAMLINQVKIVESAGTSGDDLKKAQEDGQYSMQKLFAKVFAMLDMHIVYGCLSEMNMSLSELNMDANGHPDPANLKEIETQQKKYRWSKPDGWDHTGRLTIRRSNKLFKDGSSKCEEDETMNPIIVDLYPTYLDGLAGYALTINNVAKDGSKEIKTTYHFVRYQDYAHMKVFEHFIGGVLDDLFDRLDEPGGKDL